MFKIRNENYQLVNMSNLCDLELNCCYIDWKGILYFCANSYKMRNDLIINSEDGEEIISITSAIDLFMLSQSEDEDGIEVYKIVAL